MKYTAEYDGLKSIRKNLTEKYLLDTSFFDSLAWSWDNMSKLYDAIWFDHNHFLGISCLKEHIFI